MVNSYIRARSPKGNVGVTDVVDAGELSAYSAGVLSGFDAASAASWTLQIGGVSGTQDVAIAKNPGGESELFSGTAGQSIAFVIGGAPGTPGQSRTDALVIYKDPFTTSVVNNGVDVTDYQVVAGTAATTGTQVPPDDAAIRAAISGSLYFVTVIGYVTIAYGAGSVTTANYFKNPALLGTQTVADATARALITPVEGMEVYQLDDDAKYVYTGSEWIAYDTKWQTYTPVFYTNGTAYTIGNGTVVGRYFRTGKKVAVKIRLVMGSSTTWSGASGAHEVSIPFPSNYTANIDLNTPLGSWQAYNSAVASTNGNVELSATTSRVSLLYFKYGSTANDRAALSNTAPFTSAVGDSQAGTFEYEMA